MARINLNANELSVVTSWLFEAFGYLDAAVNADGVSARAALSATPALDVTAWIRTNTKRADVAQSDWNECGMIWWIRSRNTTNIPQQEAFPPERTTWVATLQEWADSITQGFARVPQAGRDSNTVPITAENGTVTQRPAGQQLAQQSTLISKVLGVLA